MLMKKTTIKLRNRRVAIIERENNEVCLEFVKLLDKDDDLNKPPIFLEIKRRVQTLAINLSEEASQALCQLLFKKYSI